MRKYKAFTLIEIMVVIVIMGIMSAFAVPNMAKAKEKAVFSQLIQALQILHAAQLRYNLKATPDAYAMDCSELDVDLALDVGRFSSPMCNIDGSVVIKRENLDGEKTNYTIQVAADGVFTCLHGCEKYAYLFSLCPGGCPEA